MDRAGVAAASQASAVSPQQPVPRKPRRLAGRWVLVVAGVCLGQAILYGPSLVGRKILLPLDILAQPSIYQPQPSPPGQVAYPHNTVFVDLVYLIEPSRRFAAAEVRAGRWPTWAPYEYAGSPFVEYPKFSPFAALSYCFPSPVVLAWSQLALALVAGTGGYLFCRHVLHVGPRAATITAWCWPLTGSLVFWQGYHIATAICWLPWLLLAVDQTIRRTSRWTVPALALCTSLTLLAAHLDMAGQVLLASGLYAIGCFIDHYGRHLRSRAALRAMAAVAAGWGLGILLAAPQVLPMLEYGMTGARMARRSHGKEERPPVGLAALPQTVLPDMYGSTQVGNVPNFPRYERNQLESTSATYAGLCATLLAAPLAWCRRRQRTMNIVWMVLGFIGLGWCLNVPGLVAVLRLPVLNMMSHNRLVFVTSCSILALAAVGLDVLWHDDVERRWWFWMPAGLLSVLLGWCVYRICNLPEPLATHLASALRQGQQIWWLHDEGDLQRARATFVHSYAVAATLGGLGLAAWIVVWMQADWRAKLAPIIGAIWLADMLWFAYGRSAQCDPALYYPPIPALEAVARAEPGRIVGYNCLPATLSQACGVRDIRGYDSVDPGRLMDLMALAAGPGSLAPDYALSQYFTPQIRMSSAGTLRLPPVLDMLNVRYVVFRGSPPADLHPRFQSPDYWVLLNGGALPRAFVPAHVETEKDDARRLEKLAGHDFQPRQVAYVEQFVDLPQQCTGSAEIAEETPTRVVVKAHMKTAGLVVLSDLYDKSWRAYLNGRSVDILRTNHAVRGVIVPAGEAVLQFRYESASVAWGWRLSALALLTALAWIGAGQWLGRSRGPALADGEGHGRPIVP